MGYYAVLIGLIEWPYSQSAPNCCPDTSIGQQFVFFSISQCSALARLVYASRLPKCFGLCNQTQAVQEQGR